ARDRGGGRPPPFAGGVPRRGKVHARKEAAGDPAASLARRGAGRDAPPFGRGPAAARARAHDAPPVSSTAPFAFAGGSRRRRLSPATRGAVARPSRGAVPGRGR